MLRSTVVSTAWDKSMCAIIADVRPPPLPPPPPPLSLLPLLLLLPLELLKLTELTRPALPAVGERCGSTALKCVSLLRRDKARRAAAC